MTKRKVKTFSSIYEDRLDSIVNAWLDKHPEYIVFSVSSSISSGTLRERLMTIFYEVDENEQDGSHTNA